MINVALISLPSGPLLPTLFGPSIVGVGQGRVKGARNTVQKEGCKGQT